MRGPGYLPSRAFSFFGAGQIMAPQWFREFSCLRRRDWIRFYGESPRVRSRFFAIGEEWKLPAPRSIEVTQVTEWVEGKVRRGQDSGAGGKALRGSLRRGAP